jgi:hypothetical protein
MTPESRAVEESRALVAELLAPVTTGAATYAPNAAGRLPLKTRNRLAKEAAWARQQALSQAYREEHTRVFASCSDAELADGLAQFLLTSSTWSESRTERQIAHLLQEAISRLRG